MDIRQWLENTADREPPDRSDDFDIPEKFRDDRPLVDQVGRSYRNKRKRASSDSSIIAPKQPQHRNAQAPTRPPAPDHVRLAEDAAGSAHNTDASKDSCSSQRSAPVKTYERRPRHKTRADRYVPKAKKQKKDGNARKDKKPDQKRRKSHRTDDGGRTTGLVQSFQLKNGPKNNRLTLKPDASAGLFKHGRASVQMVGRGGGLPDLVFNEMRFLQKPTERQDEGQVVDDSHKRKSNDQHRHLGEEISAYFNAKTAVAQEQGDGANGQTHQTRNQDKFQYRSNPSKQAGRTKPLVELPEKPFLGFGSKGARPVSNDKNTSYYTWSDSVQQDFPPPSKRRTAPPAKDVDSTQDRRRQGGDHTIDGDHESNGAKNDNEHAYGEISRNTRHGQWIRTQRANGLPSVEVYQPPNHAKRIRRHHTPVIQTTSQSLPKHPSSPPVLSKRMALNAIPDDQQQPSYHTSDILRVRGPPMDRVETSPYLDQDAARLDSDKENHNPESSLSIDKTIRRARAAAEIPDFSPKPSTQTQKPEREALPNMPAKGSANNLPSIRRLNGGSQWCTNEVALPQQHPARPVQALSDSPTFYRPLSKTERQHWEAAAIETLASRTPHANYLPQRAHLDGDEEMLDNNADVEPDRFWNDSTFANSRDEDNLLHRQRFKPRSSILEAELNSTDHRADGWMFSGVDVVRLAADREFSVDYEMRSLRSVNRQGSPVEDELAGFWKPNKLY